MRNNASAIKEWKNKLIDDLRSHKNKEIEIYFIPKYWEKDANYNINYFHKSIKNINDLISSKCEFFIIENQYIYDVPKK